mmetsp:Transcript_7200/g.12860  ORF Transcript_7200/g.12860 Transcript_7200/m.12860 type:complete len:840 (+) Transcript_7200:124-2643(+)
MLHEVLLGLLGHEGALFDFGKENSRIRSFLTPDVLSQAEAGSLEGIGDIGRKYLGLTRYLSREKERRRACPGKSSLFVKAFCRGVQEALDWHREKVSCVEQAYLKEPGLPISRLKYLVCDSSLVFDSLLSLCEEIEENGLVGGEVLELLYAQMARCGVLVLKSRLHRIFSHCIKVCLSMMEAWMAHGILLDNVGEFFVQERPYKVVVLREEDDDDQHELIAEYEWKSRFRIREDMLAPSLFTKVFSQKVLFVGKAIRVLQRSRQNVGPGIEQQHKEQVAFATFVQVLQQSKENIDINVLLKAVDELYVDVAFWLQDLVVRQSKLMERLDFVRDFFLLGRGEFYTSFLDIGQDLLGSSPRTSMAQAEAAVNNGPWREAAIQSGFDTREDFLSLRLVLNRSKVDFRNGFTSRDMDASFVSTATATTKASNNISDLVLVGNTSIVDGGIMDISRGGFWHGAKVLVERGFTSIVTVRPGSSVTLCIQHDPFVGPTALGHDFGYQGLTNALSIYANFEQGICVGIERDGETLVKTHGGSKNSEDYTIKIVYHMQGEDRVKMVVEVSVLDAHQAICASLSHQLDICSTIQLERGSGRAWVGIIGKQTSVGSWQFSSDLAGEKSVEFDPWRSLLNLKMKVHWPLHLILTDNTLEQYGMLFQFLLCLKRVENSLKETWGILNQTRFKRTRHQNRLMMLWRLRSSMAFLVNNLQFHLQVDVIDSLEKQLMDKLACAKNFDVVEEAHARFMENLITRSFLHNKVIRNTIDTVLRRCLRFCNLVKKFARAPNAVHELDHSFAEISQSFSRDATFLYALLTRINSNLLLRVDYNQHFSKLAKGELSYRYNY